MQRFEYTTIDRILAMFQRNLGDEDITEENIVEWTGEALEELYRRGSLEECVLFAEVKNFSVKLPAGFKYISGILKNPRAGEDLSCLAQPKDIEIPCTCTPEEAPSCSCGIDLVSYDGIFWEKERENRYRMNPQHTLYGIPIPYFQARWSFGYWYASHAQRSYFTQRVDLADSRFFKTNVLKNQGFKLPKAFGDLYTLEGHTVKFNFERGQVAIAYTRIPMDLETGYPLIPDNNSYLQAIYYYIKWRVAEYYSWSGRQGFGGEADRAMALWLKYVAQARVKTIKLRTRDEQDAAMRWQSGSGGVEF